MKLSVLVVSYNTREHLARCLRSVYENAGVDPFELIVVDNASTDGSVAMVREDFPGVDLVAAEENLGYGRAMNRAAAQARGRVLLLLNADTVLAPGAVETMLARLDSSPTIGAVGPRLRDEAGTIELSFGRTLGLAAEAMQKILTARHRAGGRIARRIVEGRTARAREVDWVSGACLLVRADAFRAVGGFDEGFFLYAEDVDLLHRMRAAGYRVVYDPAAEVVHVRGASAATDPDRVAYEYRRSQLRFYAKHYGRGRLDLLRLYLLAKLGLGWLVGGSASRPLRGRLLRLVWRYGRSP